MFILLQIHFFVVDSVNLLIVLRVGDDLNAFSHFAMSVSRVSS